MRCPDERAMTQVESRLALWLIACVVGFLIVSLRWPMVGDVTYLHYVVFLMHHRMAPYRDIVDMNLPVSYMMEGAVMAIFGPGAIGWRIYDFLLIGLAAVSMISILRLKGRIAGIFAASLLIMVHAQDGEILAGERDFAVAVFALASLALLFRCLRGGESSQLKNLLTGLLLGTAICMKPTVAPVALLMLLWAGWMLHCRMIRVGQSAIATAAGLMLPVIATVVFLLRHGSFVAFWDALRGLIPYHASLAQKSLGFLLGHSVSPLLPLFLLWLVAVGLLWPKMKLGDERIFFLICAIGGLVSYLLQQKGFAYQRYPFLAFLLVLMAGDFVELARIKRVTKAIGIAGLLAGAVYCGVFLLRTTTFDRGQPARPLLSDLRALGASDGQVQCMDTAGSCIDDLYAGKLVQNTGFLYDCYLLDGKNPVAQQLRTRFWAAIEQNPPRIFVVTNSACYDPVPTFDKFRRWPEFSAYLAANYTLARSSGPQRPVRYWSRAVTPFAYRIYVRR